MQHSPFRTMVLGLCVLTASLTYNVAKAQVMGASSTVLDSSFGSTGSAVPPAWDGTSWSYGYHTTTISYRSLVSADPGCCVNITYPSCKQPAATVTIHGDQGNKLDINQTQSFDASLSAEAGLFKVLTISAGFKITVGTSYDKETTSAGGASEDVMCGSEGIIYLKTTTGTGHEGEWADWLLDWAIRDAIDTYQTVIPAPHMNHGDVFDPMKWAVVTQGPPCSLAIQVDGRCNPPGNPSS